METRRLQHALLGNKWRRFLLLLLLFSILLVVQLITSYHMTESTSAPPEADDADGSTTTTGESSATVKKKINIMTQQGDRERTRLLKALSQLETRELRNAMNLYDATWNPEAAQKIGMDHALQALKMNLLEEVSARGYTDIMAAAHQARPLSDTPHPQPLQVVIVTTWRSGSTFLEELLGSHPAVFNYYEPLTLFGLRQVRDGEDSVKAKKLIHDLISCKYEGHDDYLRSAQKVVDLMYRNRLVWKVCNSKEMGHALCFNESFITQACRLFSWKIMKTVRLRLRHVRVLLQDTKMNVRVIFLVRDPRGVINSRIGTVQWCKSPDCKEPSLLCSDMADDYKAAVDLQKDFPQRFYVLRYEDMSLNPVNKTRELLTYLGLDFDPHMKKFLDTHTTQNLDKPWSTSRESKKRVTYWVSTLAPEKLKQVQEACSPIMAKFGYHTVNSTKNVTLDDVLGPFMLPSSQ